MDAGHRLAAALAGVATVVAVGAWIVQIAGTDEGARWVVFGALWWLAPVLTVAAVVAWAAAAGLLGRGRAVVVVLLAAVGYAGAAVAAAGWNLAIEAGDAGRDAPAFTALAIPAAVAGLPFGAAAIATVLDAVGAERMPRRSTRLAAGIVTGLLLAPLAGLAGATPLFTVLPPLAVLLAIALRHAEHEPPPQRRGARRHLGLAAVLAGVALAVGAVAAVARVAAGTAALAAGVTGEVVAVASTAGALAALPLLAAVAIVAAPRAPRPVWTVAVAVAALAVLAFAQAAAPWMPDGPAGADDPALVVVGVVAFAAASGALAWGRLPLAAPSRAVIAGVAAGGAGLLALFAAPFLPIAVPFAAVAVLVVVRSAHREQRARRDQPSDASSSDAISSTSK